MKRGQIAVEYVTIMGFALLLTIPLIVIFYSNTESSQDRVDVAQAERIVRRLAETADHMHNLGEPSFTTVRAYIPEGVSSITIQDQSIIFTIEREGNLQGEVVGVSQADLSGSISAEPGIHYIRIEAVGDEVVIADT
jgi:hypothetical protein